ncbi:hypothetical protein FOZ62_025516, partial [Perkinsus olseni]
MEWPVLSGFVEFFGAITSEEFGMFEGAEDMDEEVIPNDSFVLPSLSLLLLNFLVSLTCPLGVVVAFLLQAALARKAYAATSALAAGSFTTFAVFIMGEQVLTATLQMLGDSGLSHRGGALQLLTSVGPAIIAAWLGVALVHSVHETAEGQLASDGDAFSVVTAMEAFFRPT